MLAGNAIALAAAVALALALAGRQEARVAAAERAATPLRVALVQPGGETAAPARNVAEARARADALSAQALDALAADAAIEVVVLPEKAIDFEPERHWNRSLREIAPALGVEIWTGGSAADHAEPERARYFNSAYRIRPDGAAAPRYDKNVLVPFGESMPFGRALGWLTEALGRRSFASGEGMPLHQADALRFAFLICYEAILPGYVREPVARGANLLVNLTYDGWFGDTAEPAQHLMLVAVQAAQLGVPVVRSTTTGISALVDARGAVREATALFERRVLVGDVRPLRATGLYAAAGPWFAWCCVAVSAALLWRGYGPTSRRTSTEPSPKSTAAGSISRTR
jgi:apolipoprotein N-acyltransferase